MKKLFRWWYYFRTGFGTYLVFPLSLFNTVVVTYYLLITNFAILKQVFPSFLIFLAFGITVILPLGVLFGWLHFKRTYAYTAEADISVEANPYYYKAAPGITKELTIPSTAFYLKALASLLEKLDSLSEEDEKAVKELLKRCERLMRGEELR
ncbi:MAG: hypothetical protein QXE19_04315 [Candidatus Bathyarchaeia archaeon]